MQFVLCDLDFHHIQKLVQISGSSLNLYCSSPHPLIALCDFPFPLVPLLFSQWWGQRVLSSPLVPAGVTNGNEALPAARSTNSKQSESTERKWKSVIRNSNEEQERRGAQHKGQTPKVRICAGQSLSEACITIFDCEQSTAWVGTIFTLFFNSITRLRLLFSLEIDKVFCVLPSISLK